MKHYPWKMLISASTILLLVLSITVAAQASSTIWPDTTVPSNPDVGSEPAVELGVKFQSDTSGYITGIRFYKAITNTGTHIGNLWTSDGTLLATAAFANETSSGWQQVDFYTPVAITANTAYVASYHTNVGHYSFDESYFAVNGVDNPPLHALANGVSGGNGVFSYSSISSFPTTSFNATNYWVDVVFSATAPPHPTLSSIAVTPDNKTISLGATQQFTAIGTYSNGSADITSYVTWASSDTGVASITSAGLASGVNIGSTSISATLNPVMGGTDLTIGPGGPILIISKTSNPFSRYYAEILRAEGFNEFDMVDISIVSSPLLALYDVVILGDMALTSGQATVLSNWVNAGGHLIAMRPDKKLAGLLGLTDQSSTISDAYLLVNTSSGPGVGIVGETIQYHGTADKYSLNGASSLATLYSNATTSTSNPALTLRSVGTNGGQAAAFTYDLAKSIVYTRQGNPAWEGQERDGYLPIRSDDLFYGDASFDPQPDWVDLNKVAIPQADEQQRLLANLIIRMNFNKKPLPRFWYLPRHLPAAVVMAGDDHDGNGTAGRFDYQKSMSPAGCSVENWECIRSTSYIYPTNAMTDPQAKAYVNAGFEVGAHISSNCADWTLSSLESFFSDQISTWRTKYTSLPLPDTSRIHCVVYSDYATMPAVELNHGIRLDANYYYWPPGWVNDRPGFFTGSGMPMRFTDANGNLIDVYQATTQLTDESGQTYPYTIDTLLDRAIGPEGYFGVFTVNAHTDLVSTLTSTSVVNSALAHGVPVVSARQMLTWLDGRNSSIFTAMSWNGNTLSFSISVGQGANKLVAMVPVAAGQVVTNFMYNGSPLAYSLGTIKGVQYAVFWAAEGDYQISLHDNAPPVVSTFTATSPSTSLSIPVTFTATDNIGVTGYMITESATQPTAGDGGWSVTPPTTYAVASEGTYTLYPWAKDAADNVSAVFGSPQTVVVDATPPNAPTVSGTTPTNDTTPTWTWTSSGGDGNGTYRYKLDDSNLSSGATTTTGTSYTPVSALASNATHTLYVQERDAAGNWSASGSFAIVIDTTAPTGAITYSPAGPYKLNTAVTITATFTEPMKDAPTPQIAISGANTLVASDMTKVSTTQYTYSYTVSTGTGTANVALSTGTDLAGNVVTSTPTSGGSFMVDTTAPTVAISSSVSGLTNTSPIPVTVHFSEPVSGFSDSGVAATNGSAAGTITGSGADYSFNVTPAGNGTVTVTINADAAHDAAGNENTLSNVLTWTFDSVRPTVAISTTVLNPTNVSPIPVTVTFSQAVTDFTSADVTVSNGTIGSFAGSGTTYTFTVSPNSNGTVTVDIAANVAHTLAGNGNFAASPFTRTYDTVAPSAVVSAPSLTVTKSGPVTYTVTYTGADSVTLIPGNVTLNKTGTADGTIAVTGSGTSTRTVTLSNITGNGTLGISIAANTASDLAGNTAGAAGPGTTFTVDNADGDLNGDSTVNMIDALKALRIAAGLDTPTASEGGHGDVAPLVGGQRQPDGTIDLGDVVAILRKAALLPSW